MHLKQFGFSSSPVVPADLPLIRQRKNEFNDSPHGASDESSEAITVLRLLHERSSSHELGLTVAQMDFQPHSILGSSHWPRDVFIWFNLERIKDIDTLKGQFELELVFSSRWKEDCPHHINPEGRQWHEGNFMWTPQVKLTNAIERSDYEEWYRVYSEADMRPLSMSEYVQQGSPIVWVQQFRRFTGVFAERMELYDFPFDMQLLTVTFTSSWDASRVLLRFCDRQRSASAAAALSHLQEFQLGQPLLLAYDQPNALQVRAMTGLPLLSKPEWSRTGCRYSRLHISLTASRSASPFLVNMIGIQCALTTMVFCTFRLSPEEFNDRISIDMNLVLASIAFKFVIASEIPKVPYITWLEKYCLASFAFLSLVVVEHYVASFIDFEEGDESFVIWTLVCFWAFVNLVFVVSGLRLSWHRRSLHQFIKHRFLAFTGQTAPPKHRLFSSPASHTVADIDDLSLRISEALNIQGVGPSAQKKGAGWSSTTDCKLEEAA